METTFHFNVAKLHALLRAEFLREEAEGFARLSQIPGTHIGKFLKYFRDLRSEDAAILRDALSRHALAFTCFNIAPGDPELAMTDAETEAFKRYTDSMVKVWWGWEFYSLRMLTNAAGMQKAGVMGAQEALPPDVLVWASNLKGAKATELRSLIKHGLSQKLGLRAEKHGGGAWYYKGTSERPSFEVFVDYGGRLGCQLSSHVNLRDAERGLIFERVSFEHLMGLGNSGWDFILESQVDQKIALFADLVDYTVQFYRRAIEACCDMPSKGCSA